MTTQEVKKMTEIYDYEGDIDGGDHRFGGETPFAEAEALARITLARAARIDQDRETGAPLYADDARADRVEGFVR